MPDAVVSGVFGVAFACFDSTYPPWRLPCLVTTSAVEAPRLCLVGVLLL